MLTRSVRLAPWVALGEPQAPATAPAGAPVGGEASVAPFPPEWFREHVERLWRIVARLGVPRDSVEDVVQEAFMTASRRRADIRPGHERSFLIGTAIRCSSNYRRKAHLRREVSHGDDVDGEASPVPDAEQLLIEKRARELLDRVLLEMSEAHREAFVLYEIEGLSVPEIAELLALPHGTISSRLWRARARFSELTTALRSHAEEETG
jgi:RNA polymerase sigma-70 factor, ECF subfamily